jgi:hypothetical protein
MPFSGLPAKGSKQISEPENHRFRGFIKENQNPTTTAVVPLLLKTLKNQRFSIKNRQMNWQFDGSGLF